MTLPTHPAQVEDMGAAPAAEEETGKPKKKGGKKADKEAAH